jgi:hypothetical protein
MEFVFPALIKISDSFLEFFFKKFKIWRKEGNYKKVMWRDEFEQGTVYAC